MTFFTGILINELANMTVKHTLAHPRLCAGHVFPNSTHGMPSDHSQFMAFFAVYSVLFIYFRYAIHLQCHFCFYCVDQGTFH